MGCVPQGSALGGSHGWGRQWTDLLSWPEPHSTPFRRLLAHHNIVPYLNSLLGRGWRINYAVRTAHPLTLLW